MTSVEIINYLSALSAIIAAYFWFLSAIIKPKKKVKEPDETGWIEASISINGSDLSDLIKAQSKRSATATIFAGIAAILQAIAITL
jgi:hypothetical protein